MKLRDGWELKSKIQSEEKFLCSLRERATAAPTAQYSETPPVHSLTSKVESFAAAIADSEHRLESLRADELETRCDLLLDVLARVKDFATQEILLLRYVDCLKWQDVSKRVGKSLPRCWQLHRQGVAEFGG